MNSVPLHRIYWDNNYISNALADLLTNENVISMFLFVFYKRFSIILKNIIVLYMFFFYKPIKTIRRT